MTVMLRPHRIAIGSTSGGMDWNSSPGTIRRVIYVGDMLSCEIETAAGALTVEQPTLPGLPVPRAGDAVTLSWRMADSLVFAPSA